MTFRSNYKYGNVDQRMFLNQREFKMYQSNILVQSNIVHQIFIKLLIFKRITYQVSYLGKTKMQEGLQIKTENIVCPRLNPAKMICGSKICKENAFICNKPSCQYCEARHQQCQCFKLSRVLKVLQSKKQKPSQSVLLALKTMDTIYDQVIETISQHKQYVLGMHQAFGYHEKESEFLRMINNGLVGEVTGEITSKVIQTLNIKLCFEIDEEGVKKFWNRRKSQFDTLFENFKNLTNKKVGKLESKITDQVDLIEEFIAEPVMKASQHNYSAAQFHRFCDNKKNTLVIAKTEYGRIIGGFTPLPWNQLSNYVNDIQAKTFLFSISEREKFPIKLREYGIYGYSSYGPTFGGGHDFCISNNCNSTQNSCYFNFAHSFNTQNSKYTCEQGAFTMFCGSPASYYAKVEDYQVFEVQLM